MSLFILKAIASGNMEQRKDTGVNLKLSEVSGDIINVLHRVFFALSSK